MYKWNKGFSKQVVLVSDSYVIADRTTVDICVTGGREVPRAVVPFFVTKNLRKNFKKKFQKKSRHATRHSTSS